MEQTGDSGFTSTEVIRNLRERPLLQMVQNDALPLAVWQVGERRGELNQLLFLRDALTR